MSYTEEEVKEMYDTQDEKGINVKIRTAMLEIIKLETPEQGLPVFKYILENFTEGEKTHIVSLYVAKQMSEMILKDPKFKTLCTMLKTMETIQKRSKDER